jgi:hypothetical protein
MPAPQAPSVLTTSVLTVEPAAAEELATTEAFATTELLATATELFTDDLTDKAKEAEEAFADNVDAAAEETTLPHVPKAAWQPVPQ